MGNGTGGTLGEEVEPGKFVDSEIPAAKDASEAYDTRYFPRSRFSCWPVGTLTIRGPRGVVTRFKPDYGTADTREERGPVSVQSDGTTVCTIIPRWQVTRLSGKKTTYAWYDMTCPLDSATLLEFVKEEDAVDESWTVLPPLRQCETDWPKWAREKLFDLLKSGLSFDQAKALLGVARAEQARVDAAETRLAAERPRRLMVSRADG